MLVSIIFSIFFLALTEKLPVYTHVELKLNNGQSQVFNFASQNSVAKESSQIDFIPFGEGLWLGHDCMYDEQNHFTYEIIPFDKSDNHACRYKCFVKSDCTHFVWLKKNNSGVCIMKKNMPKGERPFSRKGALCGYKNKVIHIGFADNMSVQQFTWLSNVQRMVFAENCDFPGHNYYNNVTTFDDCVDHCYYDDNCTLFSWYKNGSCIYKNGIAVPETALFNNNTWCGYKPKWQRDKKSTSIVWHHGCEFDADYNNSNKATPEGCRFFCQMSTCTHFKWTVQNGGLCHTMNSNYIGLPLGNHNPLICGYKAASSSDKNLHFRAKPQSNITWTSAENGTWWSEGCMYFSTHDFTIIETRSLDVGNKLSCGDLCASEPNCTHFNWSDTDNGTCILRSGQGIYPSRVPSKYLCGFVNKEYFGGRIYFIE